MITKEIFNDFLLGNFAKAEAMSTELANRRRRPACMSGGYLTYTGAEDLCYNLSLPKPLLATLLLVHRGRVSDAEPTVVDQLRRCLLLDGGNCMTRHGYYKMIAGLPLKDQVNELVLSYAELPIAADDSTKTEERVRTAYVARGYRCIHDEGCLLFALIDAVLRPDTALLKPLISPDTWYTPDNPCYEAMVPYFGNFETIDPAGPRFVAPHRKAALLSIVQEASEARIVAGYRLHANAFEQLPPKSSHAYGLELLLDLFACIGVKRLHALASFRLDHPDCGHGLPDLIAFRENELILIEAKRTDKLMFHQARTLHMLATLQKDLVSDVGIVKVVVA